MPPEDVTLVAMVLTETLTPNQVAANTKSFHITDNNHNMVLHQLREELEREYKNTMLQIFITSKSNDSCSVYFLYSTNSYHCCGISRVIQISTFPCLLKHHTHTLWTMLLVCITASSRGIWQAPADQAQL